MSNDFIIGIGIDVEKSEIDNLQKKINAKIGNIDIRLDVGNDSIQKLNSILEKISISPEADISYVKKASSEINKILNTKQVVTVSADGTKELIQDTTRLETAFGQVKDVISTVKTTISETGEETKEFLETTNIISTNIDKILKSKSQFSDIKTGLNTSVDNLITKGGFSDADIQKLSTIKQELNNITGETDVGINSLKEYGKEINKIVSTRNKFGDLKLSDGLNFDSSIDQITKYVAGLKGVKEESVSVSEVQKTLKGNSIDEVLKQQTILVKELDGSYRQYKLTLSSLNNDTRLKFTGEKSISSISDDEAIVKARQLRDESNKLYSEQEASIKKIYQLKTQKITANEKELGILNQRLAYEGKLKDSISNQIKENPSLKNIEKENEYLQLQIELKSKLAQSSAKNIDTQIAKDDIQIKKDNVELEKKSKLLLLIQKKLISLSSQKYSDSDGINKLWDSLQKVDISAKDAKETLKLMNKEAKKLESVQVKTQKERDAGDLKLLEQEIKLNKQKEASLMKNWDTAIRLDAAQRQFESNRIKASMLEQAEIEKKSQALEKVQSKLQYKQSNITSNITNTMQGDLSSQDKQSLEAIKNGLNEVDLASDRAEQQIREFNNAFVQLKKDIGTGKLIEAGSLDIGVKSSKADIAEYVASLKNVEASQVSVGNIGRTTFDSVGNAVNKANVEIKNADGTIDQLSLSMKTLKNGETEIRALDKGFKDASVSADSLGKSLLRMAGYFISIGTAVSLFRKAFNDMKAIDTQLTELSKVTDLVRENFQQASLEAVDAGNKWGRTAKDFLSASAEFARAGKENYKDLAEVSVLAQAAGDLTADLANKYLIASDAAFGLGGNTEKLTALLDSQNQVTNRNAVTMENMANATQVYANTANIAGETSQTMTALISAGVSSTQKSGEEVGRALRTISMRIRQIKGESDGEIIDEKSMAKAEKTLNDINISIREYKNGVMELRAPSAVLDDLAKKFQANEVSAEKMSQVLEAVAGQRQADILAGMVQNWHLYGKAMEDYTNATGSAAREAQKDLESWEGKLNVLSNTWTAFVAKTIDGELVKGILDIATAFIEFADNGIGKIILNTGLAITALTLLNKGFLLTKTSFIAHIANLYGVTAASASATLATSGFSAALLTSTKAMLAQAATWAITPFGMATIAIGAIVGITTALSNHEQKMRENAKAAIDLAKSNKQEVDQLQELIQQLEDEKTSREDIVSIIGNVNQSYADEVSALNDTNDARKRAIELLEIEARKKDLSTMREIGSESSKADNFLNTEYSINTGSGFVFKFDTPQAALENYGKAIDDLNAKRESSGKLNAIDSMTLKSLEKNYSDLEEKINLSKGALEEYDTIKARSIVSLQKYGELIKDEITGQEKFSGALINTQEDFEKFIDSTENSNKYSREFKDLIINAANTAFPEYAEAIREAAKAQDELIGQNIAKDKLDGVIIQNQKAFDDYVEMLKEATENTDQYYAAVKFLSELFPGFTTNIDKSTSSIDDLKEQIESIGKDIDLLQSAFSILTTAQEEYNETGSISIDTLQDLINNDLLQYLDISTGKLLINTDALGDVGESAKIMAIQQLQAAASSDILALAQGDVESLSNTAKSAIANMGDSVATAGSQAVTAAGQIAALAVNMQAAVDASKGKLGEGVSLDDFKAKSQAIMDTYNNIAGKVGSINIKSPNGSKKSGSSSSSTSKKETEAKNIDLDNLTLLDKKYKEIENSLDVIQKKKEDISLSSEEQIALAQKEIDLLRQQQNVQHQMAEQRRTDIQPQLAELQKYGVEVEFNPKINELEFKQTIEEIENAINTIDLGDIDKSDALKARLKGYVEEIINLNEANMDSGEIWQELQSRIQDVNLEIANADYSDFVAKNTKAIADLDYQLNLLGDNDYDQKIVLITKQFELQKAAVERAKEQYSKLEQELSAGNISASQFKSATDSLALSIQNGTIQAKQYADALRSISLESLNQQKNALSSIIELTKNLIRQEANDRIKGLNDIIKGYQDQKKALSEVEKGLNDMAKSARDSANSQKQALNDQLKAQQELANQKKKALDDEFARIKEIAAERKKAIDDEVSSYKDKIDLQKRSLDLEKEQRNYQQELADKQLSITKIQDRLAELQGNDSQSANAERLRLMEELAKRQRELDNYVYDNDIQNQKNALDSDFEMFKKKKDKEKELIDENLKAEEKAHQARLDMIESQQKAHEQLIQAQIDDVDRHLEAYENSINMQIESLQRQGEEYDRLSENVKDQIQDIQDGIANNGDLTLQAMARIDTEGDALYAKLVQWNKVYGTGVEEDIRNSWLDANVAMKGNVSTLETMVILMREIAALTKEASNSSFNVGSGSGSEGIREYFEKMGKNVDWNPDTKQFGIDGKWFDAGDYENRGGTLYATPEQIEDLLKRLGLWSGSYATGGKVRKTGFAKVHEDEIIIPVNGANKTLKKYNPDTDSNIMGSVIGANPTHYAMEVQNRMMDNLGAKNLSNIQNINRESPISIEQHNILSVEGVATDQVVKNLDSKFKAFGKKIANDVNTAVNSFGGRPTKKVF